jgi:hypothetical protein
MKNEEKQPATSGQQKLEAGCWHLDAYSNPRNSRFQLKKDDDEELFSRSHQTH